MAKGTGAGASPPFAIMNPAEDFVPGRARDVFKNDRQATAAKHASHFAQHSLNVLRVMKHVAEQYRVE
jgi:hypothetical protein